LREELDMLAMPTPSPGDALALSGVGSPSITIATLEGASASLAGAPTSLGAPSALAGTSTPGAAPVVRPLHGAREADGGWALSWCKEKYWGQMLVATVDTSGLAKVGGPLVPVDPAHARAQVIHFPPGQRAQQLLTLDHFAPPHGGSRAHERPAGGIALASVAWAPNMGRTYHLIATGGRDGAVRIWRVTPPGPDEDGRWSASDVATFEEHKASVSRVEWNCTGTVLSSAANDGRVRLWKMAYGNTWRPVGYVTTEAMEEEVAEAVEGEVED